MNRSTILMLLVLVAGAIGVAWFAMRGHERTEAVREYLTEGSRLEEEGQPARAIMVYEQALSPDSGLELDGRERAELRYRLARARIAANDLTRALATIQDMIEEDVAEHRIDVTPLLIQLGDRAMERGDRNLARLVYRLGDSVSVTMSRRTDFRERLEAFIESDDDS